MRDDRYISLGGIIFLPPQRRMYPSVWNARLKILLASWKPLRLGKDGETDGLMAQVCWLPRGISAGSAFTRLGIGMSPSSPAYDRWRLPIMFQTPVKNIAGVARARAWLMQSCCMHCSDWRRKIPWKILSTSWLILHFFCMTYFLEIEVSWECPVILKDELN